MSASEMAGELQVSGNIWSWKYALPEKPSLQLLAACSATPLFTMAFVMHDGH